MHTSTASQATVHNRVSALKMRLCTKRVEAGVLFSEIVKENPPENRLKSDLELIRIILAKQQAEDGVVGDNIKNTLQ